jgi:hypothetical protein
VESFSCWQVDCDGALAEVHGLGGGQAVGLQVDAAFFVFSVGGSDYGFAVGVAGVDLGLDEREHLRFWRARRAAWSSKAVMDGEVRWEGVW